MAKKLSIVSRGTKKAGGTGASKRITRSTSTRKREKRIAKQAQAHAKVDPTIRVDLPSDEPLPLPQYTPLPDLPLHAVTPRDEKIDGVDYGHTLLSSAFRSIRPGWRNYIHYVDLAARNGNPDMAKVIKVYKALPAKERNAIMPEQLCDQCNLLPADLFGAVCKELWRTSAGASSIIAATATPDVIGATAFYARHPEFSKDRELFLRATGMLPDKKGASVNIYNNPSPEAPDLGAQMKTLPTMEQDTLDMERELTAPDDPPMFKKAVDVQPEDSH